MNSPRPDPVGPGQESVWDYPRPPAVAADDRLVEVHVEGEVIASSRRAVRVLETSHPPGYYIPPEDVRLEFLVPESGASVCEWKGIASYWSVRVGDRVAENAAWSYPDPTRGFVDLRDFLSFYPGRVDGCFVDGEQVRPQAGEFYGGWVLDEIAGPFKGEPGTWGW